MQLGAPFHDVDDRMPPQAVSVRSEWLFAPHDQHFRAYPSRIVIGALESARIVDLGIVRSQHMRAGGRTRLIARESGLRVTGVRRAEHLLRHLLAHDASRAPRPGEHRHGLWAVVLFEELHLLLDEGVRLVPRALLPLVVLAAVFRIALHGMHDAARVVDIVLQRQAAHAQASLGDGAVLVALHMIETPILVHVQLEAASHGMAPRRRPHGSAHHREVTFLVFPRFAEVVLEFHTFVSSLVFRCILLPRPLRAFWAARQAKSSWACWRIRAGRSARPSLAG